jgi:adenylate cyclase
MSGIRKLAAMLIAGVVGHSRLADADEEPTLPRLRAARRDFIDPIISAHHWRMIKRTGEGSIIEFRSVVDALPCVVEEENGNAIGAAVVREQ